MSGSKKYQSASTAVMPFIDGAATQSDSEATVEVTNPSTGRLLFSIPAGCESDANRAVVSARRAFEDGRWSEAPPSLRKQTLYRFAEAVAAEAAALDILDAEEMGKPVSEARFCAASATGWLRFCAEAVDKVVGDVYQSDKNSLAGQRRVPRGVIAAVVPWNFPTFNALLKVAPALAAGNSVVLKPSEMSSRSAIRLAQLALAAGLPAGVLNVVPGVGEFVGRALGLHGDVNMVAFTGSTNVGKQMLQYAGQSNMKAVMAECGGKAPHIVFADISDLDAVAGYIARLLVANQGQICSVGSRLIVERSIQAHLVDRIVAEARKVTIGDALDRNTTFGPLASSQQCSRVLHYIEIGLAEGAGLATGGRRVLEGTGGYFIEPTIFQNVDPNARIAQEEIFGPVLTVIGFEDEAEAIRIANGTIYGLVAYAWTADLSRAMRLIKNVRSELFVFATPPQGEGPGHAFSGEPLGQSGLGVEGGLPGVESYMRRQTFWISHT